MTIAINKNARSELARQIERLLAGTLSVSEFESIGRTLDGADRALPEIWGGIFQLMTAKPSVPSRQRLDEASGRWGTNKAILGRCILFLAHEYEFQWPCMFANADPDPQFIRFWAVQLYLVGVGTIAASMICVFLQCPPKFLWPITAIAGLVLIASFMLWGLFFPMYSRGGDVSVWPFHSRRDYEACMLVPQSQREEICRGLDQAGEDGLAGDSARQ